MAKKEDTAEKRLQIWGERKILPLDKVKPNKGQIPGLPKNPRIIRDDKFKKLVRSIQDNPEMLSLRELLVYPYGEDYIIIGGNMRYHAIKENKYTEAPCKIIPKEATPEQLKAYMMKDNSSFGEWDFEALANEFDPDELDEWGIDVPILEEEEEEREEAKEDDYNEDDAEQAPSVCQLGDVWQLGAHRLMCGDSTNHEDIEKLMDGDLCDCYLTDPPYNVNYEGKTKEKLKIDNDTMSDGNFLAFLTDAFEAANSAMKPGASFYIWHADSEGFNFRAAAKKAGWQVRQVLVWVKNTMVLGRQDYQWKHEPCQPAGTMVMTTKGEMPIEQLKDGDRVISFDTYSGQVKGYRNGGYEIKTANRDYNGLLYSVNVAGKTTRATDNHQFSVRFNANSKMKYCVYLMQRGDWWRVGITKGYDARQFGMKTRYNQEKAERMWLLSIHEDKIQAQVQEQIITAKYGIPYTIWETDRIDVSIRTKEQIRQIYDALDLDKLQERAKECLHAFNRSEKFPFIDEESKKLKFSTRVTAKIHACNLVPGLMQLPIPAGNSIEAPNFKWESIDGVEARPFNGKVYSLSVDKYEHYISDGIITHNCLYGWKDGAAHYFCDSRKLTTCYEDTPLEDFKKMKKEELVEILKEMTSEKVATSVIRADKPAASREHPTMKPVKLIGYQVVNSTRKHDIILDSFGGSGTTLIACEQLERRCRTMELSEHYCDVIIERWQKLTGKKAVRISRTPKQQQ